MEFNSGDEYKFITAEGWLKSLLPKFKIHSPLVSVKKLTWTDGPWVGMVRLFADQRWTLPSTAGGQSDDTGLNNS